jgi:hypothetical protein
MTGCAPCGVSASASTSAAGARDAPGKTVRMGGTISQSAASPAKAGWARAASVSRTGKGFSPASAALGGVRTGRIGPSAVRCSPLVPHGPEPPSSTRLPPASTKSTRFFARPSPSSVAVRLPIRTILNRASWSGDMSAVTGLPRMPPCGLPSGPVWKMTGAAWRLAWRARLRYLYSQRGTPST